MGGAASRTLKRRYLNAIDWENVIDEIEGLARTERRTWKTASAHAIAHLLKIEYCREAADRLAEYDRDNAERDGKPVSKRSKAVSERKRLLPVECPYLLEDVIAFEPRDDLWPPSVARILNTRLEEDFPVRGRTQNRGF